MIHTPNTEHSKYIGDNVQIQDFLTGNGWVPGVIAKVSGPLSFHIKMDELFAGISITFYQG